MLITVEDGRAVAVRGNPDHPFTRGGLCVKVNNYTDRVYSPNRVLYPLRRTGPKGSKQFERIGWGLALEEDGGHIDYQLKDPALNGGGPHYIIDPFTGAILSKRYEQ